MVDMPSVAGIVAAVGVIVGVVFAILELRNLVKTRQTDLVVRLYSTVGSKEYQGAWEKIKSRQFKDYNDYMKKFGWSEVAEVCVPFEGLGVLLLRKLVDIGLVDDLFSSLIMRIWEKVKPMVEGHRKHYNQPEIYEYFEYFYNEMQKREQRLQQTQQ